MTGPEQMEQNLRLSRVLKRRHMIMISVGGVMGAGLYVGIGEGLRIAGPAVLVTFALVSFVVIVVTFFLIEMAVATPSPSSFHDYAERAYGPLVSLLLVWANLMGWLFGPCSEIIAAATILRGWLPMLPLPVLCLLLGGLVLFLGLLAVKWVGEAEFYMAFINIFFLMGFGIVALLGICRAFPGIINGVGLQNYVAHGGFAPNGLSGVMAAIVSVAMVCGGVEGVGLTAEESACPEKDYPASAKSTTFRLVFLYCFALIGLVGVLPWTSAGTAVSPFVEAIRILGGSELILAVFQLSIVFAAVSTAFAGVYLAARMIYALARAGYFPRCFAQLHPKSKVPARAGLLAGSMLLPAVVLAFFFGERAYVWLFNLSGFGFLCSWLIMILTQPRYRRLIEEEDRERIKWKAPAARWLQPVVLTIVLAGFAFQLGTATGRITLLLGTLCLGLGVLYYFVYVRRNREGRGKHN